MIACYLDHLEPTQKKVNYANISLTLHYLHKIKYISENYTKPFLFYEYAILTNPKHFFFVNNPKYFFFA